MTRDGIPLPANLTERPVLSESLQNVLQAFLMLDSERNHNWGVQAIPWTSIIKMSEYEEMTYSETEEFVFLIRGLDAHNLKKIAQRQNAEMKKSKKRR